MDPNVFLKAFCATECNNANTKMKATEMGEIHVANKALSLIAKELIKRQKASILFLFYK